MPGSRPPSPPDTPAPAPGGGPDTDAFLRLLLSHQRQIYSFIGTLLPQAIELDDVYQQTCLGLWEHRGQFDPARPFLPWAYAFARHEVFNFLRRERRTGIALSTDLLARIASAREQEDATATARRTALEECVRKLPEPQRDLLRKRYAGDITLETLATQTATTAAALTMRLQRIRHALLRCVEQALAGGGPG
jgi:RNA polymerase sigma-70 factor (ECF subfamily)